ncbi:MAG: DNA repair protein RecO [Phycisphaerales bacterium]|nr:DNA repair protein RecO [Phycisphaerae bacterium]NNF43551.1 DNA repair protein RecO [Phycisphaerales bacterium]NNM25886.1 DNA repair protein RecO [Phycisphaerales bacterium]
MPPLTDQALCLRHWDFSETSQTVSLLTREHGVLRGLAKGARRERGRFSGGIEVLTRGQVVAFVKPGRELANLSEWHLEETFRALRERLTANRVGLLMADLLHHMLTDSDPHPALFDAAVSALRRLKTPGNEAPALLQLQWVLLVETGYRPELDRDVETGDRLPDGVEPLRFNPRRGGLVASSDPEGWGVRRATVDLLRRVAAGEGTAEAEPATVTRANRLLAAYCRELLGTELPSFGWAFDDA